MAAFTFRHVSNGAEIADGIDTIRVRTLADGSKEIAVHTDGENFSVIQAELVQPAPAPDPAPTPDPDPTTDPAPDPTPTPDPVPSPSADVTDRAGLLAVIGTPGTYRLAGGSYGAISGISDGVTLKSADPANPAVFDQITADGTSNVTLDGLTVAHPGSDTAIWAANSVGLIVTNCHISGDSQTFGIRALDCDGLAVTNCTFTGLQKGMLVRGSNILITGNDISEFRSDGMTVDDVDGIQISGNYIHDRKAANTLDHGDYIQFMGQAHNCVVADNFIDQNAGDTAQSIYFGAATSPKSNLKISDNVVIGSQTHGVSTAGFQGGQVTGNRVAQVPATNGATGGVTVPKVNIKGAPDTMTGNVAPQVLLNGTRRPAGNTEAMLDPAALRAEAQADPRWSHFFG